MSNPNRDMCMIHIMKVLLEGEKVGETYMVSQEKTGAEVVSDDNATEDVD